MNTETVKSYAMRAEAVKYYSRGAPLVISDDGQTVTRDGSLDGADPAEQLNTIAQRYIAGHPTCRSHSEALQRAGTEDPALGRRIRSLKQSYALVRYDTAADAQAKTAAFHQRQPQASSTTSQQAANLIDTKAKQYLAQNPTSKIDYGEAVRLVLRDPANRALVDAYLNGR